MKTFSTKGFVCTLVAALLMTLASSVQAQGWISKGTNGSATPSGAAGGDLGGTYPNPTVAQLTGSASTVTLVAGTTLSGAAGAGALSLGSMTGAAALPTGNLSWAGAATKTGSLVAAGAFTITGGAASTWSTSAGALTLTSAAAATWSTSAGVLTLNGTAGIILQTNAVTVESLSAASGDFLSIGANAATTGALRFANGSTIYSRNAANNTNLALIGVDASNNVNVGSVSVPTIIAGSNVQENPGGGNATIWNVAGLQLFSTVSGTTTSFGGGIGVLGITNAGTAPTSNPSGGIVVSAQSGGMNVLSAAAATVLTLQSAVAGASAVNAALSIQAWSGTAAVTSTITQSSTIASGLTINAAGATNGINLAANGLTLMDIGVTTANVVTLSANTTLSAVAGTGQLSLGSMTGAVALPTGNLSWTGASTKTVSLVSTGAGSSITLTAGAASTWSTSAGALTLTSAAAATWGVTTGSLTINGGGVGNGVNLQTNGLTIMDIGITSTNTVTLTANTTLNGAAGTGQLSLGNMTGAVALPTGNLSWAGASTKTVSIVSTGAGSSITLTAGAASTWSTSAGALTLTSAAAATWSTTSGDLTVSGNGNLVLGTAAVNNGNVVLNPGGTGLVKFGYASTALGAGGTATLGAVGGSGPATTGQNAWYKMLDSTGAAFWVPIWK